MGELVFFGSERKRRLPILVELAAVEKAMDRI
jgi:hypothetical protein